jgi:hypothetical protein
VWCHGNSFPNPIAFINSVLFVISFKYHWIRWTWSVPDFTTILVKYPRFIYL